MKIDANALKQLSFIEKKTRIVLLDCVTVDDISVFVLKPEDMGKLIGNDRRTLRELEKAIGTSIMLIAHSKQPTVFLANIIRPAKARKIEISGDGHSAKILLNPQDKYKLGRKKINVLKTLAERHLGITSIKLSYS
ncbi:MAG: NusA-like transcription termination signal-binding factor [Candidatus Diapherotrites archaeon]|nr:NusA-like transcription termination signal-binding factor [Candidatus Diapherotrites archaeon]